MHHCNHEQRKPQSRVFAHVPRQADEQSAAEQTPEIQPQFMVKNIGELIAFFNFSHHVYHFQLNGEIRNIEQRAGKKQARHEQDHAQSRIHSGIEQSAKDEQRTPDAVNQQAVFWPGHPTQHIQQDGRQKGANGLNQPQRAFFAHKVRINMVGAVTIYPCATPLSAASPSILFQSLSKLKNRKGAFLGF